MVAVLLISGAAVVKRHWQDLRGNEPSVSVGQPGHFPNSLHFKTRHPCLFPLLL